MVERIKTWAKDNFSEIKKFTTRQWQILIGTVLGSVLVLIAFFIFVPQVQQTIRNDQVKSVVFPEIKQKKVSFLTNDQMKKTLADHKQITIFYLPTNSHYVNEVKKILQDKKITTLNEGIYAYPMVYNTGKESKTYEIDYAYPTAVYYENGKEENRLEIKKESHLATLIDDLNALPMENIKLLSKF